MQIVAELWLILELTDSGAIVGLATAFQFAGILIFGAWGGSLADRFDKRKLLIVTQTAMAAPALALFAFALAGSAEVWIVLALIAVRGLVLAIDNPARQAFVIEMVGPDRVVNAVSLNSVIVHSARIAGPALAGLFIALWGVTPCFAFNAATFAVMVGALVLMRPTELSRPPREEGHDGFRIRDALSHVARTPELRTPLLLMAVLGTLGFNFQVILPLLARFSFDGGVDSYSLLMAAMGAGAVAGSLVAGARGALGPRVTALAAAAFGGAALIAAMAPTLHLEMLALVALGAASVTFAASINSGLQLAAEPHMRGRIMSLYAIVFLGSTPIGGPLSGWLAESVSPRAAMAMAGIAGLAVALAALIALRRSEPVADAVAELGFEPEEIVPEPVDPATEPATDPCHDEGRRRDGGRPRPSPVSPRRAGRTRPGRASRTS
jgi:MFS family permease